MTDRMHDLLDRLAEEAPPPRMDPGLFRRAQRARRRDRVVAGAVAAGVVVAVAAGSAGLGSMVLRGDGAPATTDRAPAMPTRIHAVPQHVDDVETDLAVGITAAAFYDHGPAAVLVSAVDGSYQRVDLPTQDERRMSWSRGGSMSLSPDGTRLAFAWHAPLPARSGPHVPSGVAVADLRTGEVRRFERPGDRGVMVANLSWSPDGRYLGYGVFVQRVWDRGMSESRVYRTERLDLETGRAVRVPLGAAEGTPAVANDGRVAMAESGSAGWWDPRAEPAVTDLAGRLRAHVSSAAWSPSGRHLALGSFSGARGRVVVLEPGTDPLRTIESGDSGGNRVLGWVDETRLAVLHTVEGEATGTLQVVPADGVAEEPGVVVDLGWSSGHTFATDLLAEPTREFPAPDWPPDWGAVAGYAVVTALAGAVLLVGLRLWRRRTR